MSPSDLEPYLEMEPMPTLRLTLASGDQVIIRHEDKPFIATLALVLRGPHEDREISSRSRLISIPNIALVEPVVPGRSTGGRRRMR